MILPGKGKKESPTGKAEPRKGSWRAHGAHARSAGLEEEEKRVEQAARRKRRARAEAKDVLSAIGYDAMYADGTAQVEEGLFSQTIEFGDISYQSAREENQQSVFAAMSELYDYFGSETSVQLTIINTPIPEREIGRKRFFEKSDPRVDRYVEEYNRILNDKMREGVSNLVRHRYLTFLVGADDVDAAAPRLARARSDCMQTLARIRCESRTLDGSSAWRCSNPSCARDPSPRSRGTNCPTRAGFEPRTWSRPPCSTSSPRGARTATGRTTPGAACLSSAASEAIWRTIASPTSSTCRCP